MASGQVRSAISTALEKTATGFTRSFKLKEGGQEILSKSCLEETNLDSFDTVVS